MAHWEQGSGFDVSHIIETTKEIFTDPTAFYQRTPKSGDFGRPLTYGVTVGSIGFAASMIWQFLQTMLQGAMQAGDDGTAAAFGVVGGLVACVVLVVLSPLFSALGIFIGTAILHVCLMVVGGAKHGFDATLRVVAYAQAPQLLGLVPICGGAIAYVWMLVLEVIGCREVHGCTTPQAVMAVLIPLILCCCCAGAIGIFFGASIAAAVAAAANQ